MLFVMNKKGFTLIEIVLVLVLLGILATVAASKYYDLKDKAKEAAAYAYANQFSAEINNRVAKLLLEGKTCLEARKKAISEISPKYFKTRGSEASYESNPNNLMIYPFWMSDNGQQDYFNKIVVLVNGTEPIETSSNLVACSSQTGKEHP